MKKRWWKRKWALYSSIHARFFAPYLLHSDSRVMKLTLWWLWRTNKHFPFITGSKSGCKNSGLLIIWKHWVYKAYSGKSMNQCHFKFFVLASYQRLLFPRCAFFTSFRSVNRWSKNEFLSPSPVSVVWETKNMQSLKECRVGAVGWVEAGNNQPF